MVGIEQKIRQKLVSEGFIDSSELQECIAIKKVSSDLGINISLNEIIIHKFPRQFFNRQNYLEILIHILETPEISKIIDYCTLELGDGCAKIFTDQEAQDSELHKSLLANGVVFPKSYTNVLKNTPLRNLQNIKIRRNDLAKWEINLTSLLQTAKNNELMPLNTPLPKLVGKTLPFSTLEKARNLQQKIKGKISLPLIHILIKKYKIEPYLLHAIIISQARIENDKIELWLGGTFITSHTVNESLKTEFICAQDILTDFLETSFSMNWLGFRLEKEVLVVENLQRYASSQDWAKAIDIRKQLAKKQFPFSLLKIIVYNKFVSESRVFTEVLKNIYKVSPQQAQEFARKIYKDNVEEAPPLMNINLDAPSPASDMSYLEKTMSLNDLGKKRPRPTNTNNPTRSQPTNSNDLNKTITRSGSLVKKNPDLQSLDKTISRSGSLVKENPDLQSLDKTVTRSSTAERIRQRVLKAQQKKEDLTAIAAEGHLEEDAVQTIQAKISKHSLTVRAALKKEYITEDMVVDATILQGDPGFSLYGAKILDILREQKQLTTEQHNEVLDGIPDDAEAKIPVLSKNMDLKISNELIEHNMVTREQIQKVFRVQRSLQHNFIVRSVDGLIILMKVAPTDIVEPVVLKIKQSLRKSVSNQEIKLSNEPMKSQGQRNPVYSMALIIFTVVLLSISFYNFSSFYYDVEKEQSDSKITKSKTSTNANSSNEQRVVKNTQNANPNAIKKTTENPKKNVEIKGITLRPHQIAKIEDPNKNKRAAFPITLEKSKVVFLNRHSSYGLIIAALFKMDRSPGAFKTKVKVQLYDMFKSKVYKEDKVQLNSGKMNVILGPINKKLCEHLYYIKLSIIPKEQTPSIRRFYQIKKTQEWWISYLHSNSNSTSRKENILRATNEEKNRINKLAKALYKQNKSLEKFLKKKPQYIRQNYQRWKNKWQKTQDKINKELQDRFFIPVFEKTEKHLFVLSDYVNTQSKTLHKWVTSFDLFPPQMNQYEWKIKWSEFQQYLQQDQKLVTDIISAL
ncbi:hypothetical protein [Candidatus Uabimicrobium sp. HlEnr_7]|uniref:hypothetical protein n=1 Tax=Candidatus Uabimicrobium helgolandensis TaxID=3095367 RepID=UPI003556DBC1